MRSTAMIASVVFGLSVAGAAWSQTPTPLTTTRIASGLTQPLYITSNT